MRRLAALIAVILAAAWAPSARSGRQRTLAIIKPDAVASASDIVAMAEQRGLRVVARKTVRLTRAEASLFYREHSARPFFAGLVEFMCSGPAVALILEGEDAISGWRQMMGPTNSLQAKSDARTRKTIRARFGTDGQRNAVHGSDSDGSARREIDFFFGARALVPIHFRMIFDRMVAVLTACHL